MHCFYMDGSKQVFSSTIVSIYDQEALRTLYVYLLIKMHSLLVHEQALWQHDV